MEPSADDSCVPEKTLHLTGRERCRDIKILRLPAEHHIADSAPYYVSLTACLLYLPDCPEGILIYLAVGYRMFLLRINLRYRNTPAFTVILITYEHGSTLVKQGTLCKTNRKITSDCPCFSLMLSSGHD